MSRTVIERLEQLLAEATEPLNYCPQLIHITDKGEKQFCGLAKGHRTVHRPGTNRTQLEIALRNAAPDLLTVVKWAQARMLDRNGLAYRDTKKALARLEAQVEDDS